MEGGCKLTNREFIVEIMDAKLEEKLTKEIINCDGKIGNYIDEKHPPFMVISDSPIAAKLEKMTCEEQREFNKKAKLPMLLRDAVQNRVKIAYAVNFLDKLKQRKSLKLQPILARPSAKRKRRERLPIQYGEKTDGICVRIEDEGREFAPLQKELETLPVMYTGKDYGASLFLKSDETTRAKRRDELQQEKDGNLKYVNVDSQTAGANNNKPPNKQTGNCEICNRRVSNLQEHYGSKEHLKNTSAPGFFDEVDQYIGSYVPHIKCPGKPVLLRRPRTPSPVLEFEDYVYGETNFGRLSDDE